MSFYFILNFFSPFFRFEIYNSYSLLLGVPNVDPRQDMAAVREFISPLYRRERLEMLIAALMTAVEIYRMK